MSQYTLAGCETLWNYFKHELQTVLTLEELQAFLHLVESDFLHSFGQNFKGKFAPHLKSEIHLLKSCRKLYQGCKLIYDSGGYQISINKLPKQDLPEFTEMYYNQFLGEYHEDIDRAFILDLPPGPGCEAFENFDELYELNKISYLLAKNLPPEIKKKIVYIHHFRSPKLFLGSTRLMREENLFDEFQYHGTGGLVANQSTDTKVSYLISSFPLVQLLNECIRFKRTSLDFHVLGNATFKDILFYQLMEHHIRHVHGINVRIGFDSSGLYGEVMTGRTIRTIDKNFNVSKINLKEAYMDHRFIGSKSQTNRQKLNEVIFEMCEETGLKPPPEQIMHDVYYTAEDKKKDGSIKYVRRFHPIVRLYIALYYLYSYARATKLSTPIAEELYDAYTKDLGLFSQGLGEFTRRANFGKITRKQKLKSEGLDNTLKLLTHLNEERVFQLIRQYLGSDEFEMPGDSKLLKI